MTYDYECTHCGHRWDTEQKITDKPLKHCPKCNRCFAKRLISGAGNFQLMGSGWAKDGYK